MVILSEDELWVLEYYGLSRGERGKVKLRDVKDYGEVINSLVEKKFIRPVNRTYQQTYKGREWLARKKGKMPKHEVYLPWMAASTVADIAWVIKLVDAKLKESPVLDFEKGAAIAVAVDQSSTNLFVKVLVQQWYSVDKENCLNWANSVLKEQAPS